MSAKIAKFDLTKRKRWKADKRYWQSETLCGEKFQCIELPSGWLCRTETFPGCQEYGTGKNAIEAMSSIRARHLLDPAWRNDDDRERLSIETSLLPAELELADTLAKLHGVDRGRTLAAGLQLLLWHSARHDDPLLPE